MISFSCAASPNIVIYFVIMICLSKPWSWPDTVVSSGAGAHFPQLRLGVHLCFRHLATATRDIGHCFVFRCAVVVLHDADLWNSRPCVGRGAGRWSACRAQPAAALSDIVRARHCWLTRSTALAGGAGVDRRRLDAGGVRVRQYRARCLRNGTDRRIAGGFLSPRLCA